MMRRWGMLMAAALGCAVAGGIVSPGCVYYLNPQCNDEVHNGDETDVDCGGPCGRCNIGDSCRGDIDCDESMCTGGTCTPFPCNNGRLDPGETDIDCGGPECRRCSGLRGCEFDADCFSGECLADNTCSALRTVSFASPMAYPSGDKTYALFAADLDRNGSVDLVAANEQGSSLSVFLNNGSGSFRLAATPFETGEYPTGGAIADFNHDGMLDVVTADYHGNSVTVLLGTGTGILQPRTTYPTLPGAFTQNVAVGDLDGDGNLDVIATNPAKASISVFFGHADGTFDPAVDVAIGIEGGYQPFSVAIADFDGNGTADVAVADIITGPIVVKLGNGDGTLQSEVLYDSGGVGPNTLLAVDMNRDGKLDLVSANRNADSVSVLLGRGDGTFRKALVSSVAPVGVGPYSIAVDDFNRDGVPDVVTPNWMSDNGTILLGVGDGSFEAPIDTGATGRTSYGVATGDFDGDGVPDFATANAGSFDVAVKMNTSH